MNISSLLGFAMSLIYLGLGIYLLFVRNLFFFKQLQQTGIGIILISYGAFRFYRALKKMKEQKSEDNIEHEE